MVHNSDVLFPTNSTNQTVGSDIISAIVTGTETVKNLPEPVVLEFAVSFFLFAVLFSFSAYTFHHVLNMCLYLLYQINSFTAPCCMTSTPNFALTFQLSGEGANCVFWDFEITNWSQEGCQLVKGSTNTRRVTCHCDHLTNFAVLVVNISCDKH